MKISGIVCEYNPMHNGHVHHIRKTRENGATHILCVMSGNFVQRGETALMDKFSRAETAVSCGADLVIEIPTVYCLSSAEFYARGAVSIMHSLGCVDEISFGSECGDIETLKKASEAVLTLSTSDIETKLRSGLSYPSAVSAVLCEKYGNELAEIAASPNNILAIEYLKTLSFLNSDISPFTVKRIAAEHDSSTTDNGFASASHIRKMLLESERIYEFVPQSVYEKICENRKNDRLSGMENLERIVLYRLRTMSAEQLLKIPDVGQGLEYRLKQYDNSGSIRELLENVKTRRYTMARLRRILMNMIIGVTAEDLKNLPPYAKILAMNERGREILARCKNSTIPISTSLSKLSEMGENASRFAQLEAVASDIFGLSQNNTGSRNDDFRAKVRIIKNED